MSKVDSLWTYLSASQLPTGRAIIQVARPSGENTIVLVPGANHAGPEVWPKLRLERGEYSHLLVQNEIPLAETCATLTEAHKQGVVTVFNPSPLPSSKEIKENVVWEAVDWLVVNEEEGRTLTQVTERRGRCTEIDIEQGAEEDTSGLVETLIRSSLATVGIVLTLGAKGCHVGLCVSGNGDQKWVIFSSPPSAGERPVIDTTGARDCFTVGLVRIFAAHLLQFS